MKFEFNDVETQAILDALQELPFKRVNHLLVSVLNQIKQNKEAASIPPPSAPPPTPDVPPV